jgi:hypothetical protein
MLMLHQLIDKSLNRRQFGRRSAFKIATIAQVDGQRLAATVIELSQAGARLRIPRPEDVENEFYLEIQEDDFIVKCRLVHIQETSIGVAFVGAPHRLSWIVKRK